MSDVVSVMIADAIRMWGFLAAIVGFDDLRGHWLIWRNSRRHPDFDRVWIAFAKLGVFSFLLGAGIGIPIARRIGLTFQEPHFEMFMAFMWAMISAAGWAFVVSKAAKKRIMAGVATGALILAMVSSWATWGG